MSDLPIAARRQEIIGAVTQHPLGSPFIFHTLYNVKNVRGGGEVLCYRT